jgi:hypothetical protein
MRFLADLALFVEVAKQTLLGTLSRRNYWTQCSQRISPHLQGRVRLWQSDMRLANEIEG